jgi:cytochrome c oxidase subunit 2
LQITFYIPVIFFYLLILLISCQSNNDKVAFTPGSPEYKGQDLFVRMACNACHTVDGTLKLGPTMKSQYGKEMLHTDGTVMIINDDYIRQSLIYPLKHITEGYTPIMPSYKPVLSDEDIMHLIAYIKSLK